MTSSEGWQIFTCGSSGFQAGIACASLWLSTPQTMEAVLYLLHATLYLLHVLNIAPGPHEKQAYSYVTDKPGWCIRGHPARDTPERGRSGTVRRGGLFLHWPGQPPRAHSGPRRAEIGFTRSYEGVPSTRRAAARPIF